MRSDTRDFRYNQFLLNHVYRCAPSRCLRKQINRQQQQMQTFKSYLIYIKGGGYMLNYSNRIMQQARAMSQTCFDILLAQKIRFMNVTIRGYSRGAIHGRQMWDSFFYGNEYYYCGLGNSDTAYEYAVKLVTIDGSGLISNLPPAIASGTVRSKTLNFSCDVSMLVKTLNDVATNNNNTLACGTGPVVCGNSPLTWKHIYTGNTY